jgi:hypothetical protein
VAERAKANAKKDSLNEVVIANHNRGLDNAIEVLERVLANCHNQGGGN